MLCSQGMVGEQMELVHGHGTVRYRGRMGMIDGGEMSGEVGEGTAWTYALLVGDGMLIHVIHHARQEEGLLKGVVQEGRG